MGWTETYTRGWVGDGDNSKNQIWRGFTRPAVGGLVASNFLLKRHPTTLPLYHSKAPAPAVKCFHLTACPRSAPVIFGRFSPISYMKNFFSKYINFGVKTVDNCTPWVYNLDNPKREDAYGRCRNVPMVTGTDEWPKLNRNLKTEEPASLARAMETPQRHDSNAYDKPTMER